MTAQAQLALQSTSTDFLNELSNFNAFGEKTICENVDGVSYFINEFWTSRQRQAHRLHEISYRACFKPQLPAFFIDRLTAPAEKIYDPFMGRGTTPLEAALRDRIPIGNDTNPLSRALVEPRLRTPSFDEVKTRLAEIPWETFDSFEHDELLVFYHPTTLAHIEGLRNWLMERELKGLIDQCDRWI